MDKRQLSRDIAIVRKQIFSLSAFSGFIIIGLATLAGQGLNFYLIFQNSLLAIIIFGIVGLLLGYVYEKSIEKSLIESYRVEAKQRIEELKSEGSQKLTMPMNISELSAGMKVVEAVQSQEGALLVRSGQVVNERIIQTLRENNIQQVMVEAQRNLPTNNEDEGEAEL